MAQSLDTPQSANANTLNYSISAGTLRVLIAVVQTEGTQSGDLTCTYGGEPMTLVVQEIAGSSTTQQTVGIFFLNETGIQAAGSTALLAGNYGSVEVTVHAASYENCLQTTPTNYDTDTSGASTPNPLASLDITTSGVNSVVVAASGCGNATTASWAAPLNERTDQISGSSAGTLADDEVATAQTVACECTWANQNRAAAVALEIETGVTYEINGVTKDNDGDPLGSCECFCFKDNGDNTLTFIDHTVSNSSTGAYTFTVPDSDSAYLVYSYKDDSPHVFDVTDHVLQGT
jgi:hypothetical protein